MRRCKGWHVLAALAVVGLLNSLWSLILPGLASPLAIFMMRQFMEGQPREYEEAAFVDGASDNLLAGPRLAEDQHRDG